MKRELTVYIGTYTHGSSGGIYCLRLDLSGRTFSKPSLAAFAENPSYLAVSPDERFLYAVSETARFAGRDSGAVSAFEIDAKSGRLRLLNQQPTAGAGPCHLTVTPDGRHVLVANYSGGSICVLPVKPDGKLGEPSDIVQHLDLPRADGPPRKPHAHSIALHPEGKFAYAADLGLDSVFVYRFDREQGTIRTANIPPVRLPDGAGPRHLAFAAGGSFAYVLNELASTVASFSAATRTGYLTEMQTVSTLPDSFTGNSAAAEISVHPTRNYLYCSNRGHDSIAVFNIDCRDGMLTPVEHTPSGGQTPRHFSVDPTGQYLVTANQDSDLLATFRIDPDTGRLYPTGAVAEVPSPACVQFVPNNG